MAEILENLPAELYCNVIKFLGPHPLATALNQAIQNTQDEHFLYKIELGDLAKLTMTNYKEKCRKKPKHGELMKQQLQFYQSEIRRCKRKNKEPPSSFYEYYF